MINETQKFAGSDNKTEVNQLRDQLAELKKTIEELRAEKLNSAKDKAENIYNKAKENGSEFVDKAKEKLGSFESDLCDYVKENPKASLAAALGVGALLALIIR
ncbi:DUF883 family protein [Bartonella sp. DGB2]|uniref:DUF883 family protein n=1 Tax=Bartonella sp. DGB2 TaxID=3388426 RepID=UPI00398FB4C5